MRDDQRLVEVWMTRAERDDPVLRERLKPLCQTYKPRRYTVAVYASGRDDLFRSTLALLSSNRKRMARDAEETRGSMVKTLSPVDTAHESAYNRSAKSCQAPGDDPVSTGVIEGGISEPWALHHVKTGTKSN